MGIISLGERYYPKLGKGYALPEGMEVWYDKHKNVYTIFVEIAGEHMKVFEVGQYYGNSYWLVGLDNDFGYIFNYEERKFFKPDNAITYIVSRLNLFASRLVQATTWRKK